MTGWERPGWLVRVRRTPGGTPVGAGVLCTDRHVLTCAHVVDPAMGPSPPEVVVDFPFAEPHEPLVARVRADGWFPAMADGTGDLAVLELDGPLPLAARPAALRVSAGVTGHRVRAGGFPAGHDGVVTATGTVVGPAEAQWLQVLAESTLGFSLEAGFSGTPLWDEDVAAVVGIVVSRERPRGQLGDPRTGYAIPFEVVERYWPPLRPWLGWRLDHDPDLSAHWDPRARGVARRSLPGWHFTGRTAALTRLAAWLGEAAEPILVVTGGPGSGKSSVLARVVTLADPVLRGRIRAEDPDQLADPALVPPLGAVSTAVRCSGLDLGGVCRALSRFDEPTTDPDTVVANVVARDGAAVVVVDALDEAVNENEARSIVVRLLRPLTEAGARVLVGTRRGHGDSLLRAFGHVAGVDLDDPEFFEQTDLAGYARRLLLAGSYRDAPAAAREVAEAIAHRSRPSFLVTGLTARTWAARPAVDVSRPGWEHGQGFPVDVDEAMREYLARLPDPDRALALLRLLAHGRQPGLPLGVWEAASAAYLPAVSRAELDGLLRTAASYLVEQRTVDGEPVVRLFHQSLVDHLVGMDTSGLVERTIVDVLVDDTRARGGWSHAGEYARLHAATHAAAVGGQVLEALVTDPEFLVVAERGPVLRALRNARGERVAAVGGVYRAAAHALTGPAPVNAAYLELAARRFGERQLAERLRSLPVARPFTPRVVTPSARPADQLTMVGHTAPISALTWGSLHGQPVLISGALDGTVFRWDPVDGSLLDTLEGDGAVLALGWVELDGVRWFAAAWSDGVVALLHPTRPEDPRVVYLAAPDSGSPPAWPGAVTAVPPAVDIPGWHTHWIGTWWGRLADAPVVLHAFADGDVHGWRVEDGALVLSLRAHLFGQAADWGEVDGRPVLVTVGEDEVVDLRGDADDGQGERPANRNARAFMLPDGDFVGHGWNPTIRYWDPERRLEQSSHVMAHVVIGACALAEVGGRAVLAVACDDGAVRFMDADGEELVAFHGDDTPAARVRVLDVASGAELAGFPGKAPLAWGSVGGATVLACAGDDVTVQVRDPRTAALLHTFTTNDAVATLAWGEFDDRPVLTAGGGSGRIQLWPVPDLVDGDLADSPRIPVRALAWGVVDGRVLLAAGRADGRVEIVDPADPDAVVTIPAHDSAITHVAWGEALATADDDGDIAVWDPVTGQRLLALPDRVPYLRMVSWVRLAERDLLAVATKATDLQLWSLDGQAVTPGLPAVGRPVRFLFTAQLADDDGESAVVVCGACGEVRVHDPVVWSQRHTFNERVKARRAAETCLATTFVHGTPVTARGDKDGRLVLWYPRDGDEAFEPVDAHDGPVVAVAWASASALLASGGADGRVLVWDVRDPDEPAVLHAIVADGPVNALAWHRLDDEDVVVAGTADGSVDLYRAADGHGIGGLRELGGAVTALAPGDITAIGTAGGDLWLMLVFTDGQLTVRPLPVGAAVSALAWGQLPDGRPALAIGSADGGVSVWSTGDTVNMDDLEPIRTVAPPTGAAISALTWSPTGPPTLIAGTVDGTVQFWDVAAAVETQSFHVDGHVDTALATGRLKGRAVLAATGAQLRVWDIATATLVLVSDDETASSNDIVFGEVAGRTVLLLHAFDGVRLQDLLLLEPRHTGPPPPERTAPAEPIIDTTDSDAPVVAFGTLAGRPAAATGNAAGLITVLDLETGTHRTIHWYNPVHTLSIGPDDLLAIGDSQGYTVIQLS